MRRTVLLLAAMATALLLASGIALAATVKCPNQSDGSCVGTAGADTMKGTSAADTMFARAGNDTLLGFAGNDSFAGMAGNDTSKGGNGDDFYFFEAANWGADTLVDTLQTVNIPARDFGNAVGFSARANNGAMTIRLIPSDLAEVKKGTNTVNWAGPVISSVHVSGENGGERIFGNAAPNFVDFRSGGNTVSSGGGNDWVQALSGAGNAKDTINCGAGWDVVFYDAGVDQITNCEERYTS